MSNSLPSSCWIGRNRNSAKQPKLLRTKNLKDEAILAFTAHFDDGCGIHRGSPGGFPHLRNFLLHAGLTASPLCMYLRRTHLLPNIVQ